MSGITWHISSFNKKKLFYRERLIFSQLPALPYYVHSKVFLLCIFQSWIANFTTDNQKQVVICFEYTKQLWLVMVLFFHSEKACLTGAFTQAFSLLWDGMSWIYYSNDALFITTVFTSMNIHDGTTWQEWRWNCKTN